jgi:hypothetical protein
MNAWMTSAAESGQHPEICSGWPPVVNNQIVRRTTNQTDTVTVENRFALAVE